jgi:hypothetical protein
MYGGTAVTCFHLFHALEIQSRAHFNNSCPRDNYDIVTRAHHIVSRAHKINKTHTRTHARTHTHTHVCVPPFRCVSSSVTVVLRKSMRLPLIAEKQKHTLFCMQYNDSKTDTF